MVLQSRCWVINCRCMRSSHNAIRVSNDGRKLWKIRVNSRCFTYQARQCRFVNSLRTFYVLELCHFSIRHYVPHNYVFKYHSHSAKMHSIIRSAYIGEFCLLWTIWKRLCQIESSRLIFQFTIRVNSKIMGVEFWEKVQRVALVILGHLPAIDSESTVAISRVNCRSVFSDEDSQKALIIT